MHRPDTYYPAGIGLSRLLRGDAPNRSTEERLPCPRDPSSTSRNAGFCTKKSNGYRGGNTSSCGWKQCRSCTGGAVADCVAIACCPCALFNCMYLALVRIPYLIGKRWCLRFRRRKRRRRRRMNKNNKAKESAGSDGARGAGSRWFEEQGITGRTIEKVDEEKEEEVYEFDHLSFGRVSFTGFPPFQQQHSLIPKN